MQFKNPEILYALLLLLIPILIHLFQLRRFKKVAFTNVQLLKNISIQTRKSSQLKKWLTLLTRMLLLACIIIAFAQPFLSNLNSLNTKSETVIYLDNSFSMQAKGVNGTLLNTAIQELLENVGENENISLFTNNSDFKNTSIKAIRNDLIELTYSSNQLDYDAVILKGTKAFSHEKGSTKNFLIISDFQQNNSALNLVNDSQLNYRLVQLKPVKPSNTSIDSLYISKSNAETLELTVLLSNQGLPIENMPVALLDNGQLIAKTAISINKSTETIFTIPNNKAFNGKITIDDPHLNYDNSFYFSLNNSDRIKVLAINEADATFLERLYSPDEFDLTLIDFEQLNYSSITDQNLIILNQLKSVPNSLTTSLTSFSDNGGSILIIPSDDTNLNTYNHLFSNLSLSTFNSLNSVEKRITNINFSHPLLNNVFDKKVDNFQYPKVNANYKFGSAGGTAILSYEDNTPFLIQSNASYTFSAALDETNSNFKNSPLIVPVLYNIGKQSLKLPRLYYTIGKTNTIDINTSLNQDAILKLKQDESTLIPQQKTYNGKVRITTDEYPRNAGFYNVTNKREVIKRLSFNYNRSESFLDYMDLSTIKNSAKSSSVASAIADIKSMTNVDALWKWFVIFAIAFLIIEMLILKSLK
ncbi:putative membrane protein (TIGR02226 family) [Gelidibacter sediminis]|uniref:Putative membrane protein (TIGR02226 family) n=1 Tax=Gelidibacter sediminis TaxID=1608710 RepID=A0A4R7PY96_9FLAO|nr:BatA domain-containing protein [Gelidibacter sediminis]TDU39964.1 putative membrane protein (TIGR02226 family) [Gelidibacter sediminis]